MGDELDNDLELDEKTNLDEEGLPEVSEDEEDTESLEAITEAEEDEEEVDYDGDDDI